MKLAESVSQIVCRHCEELVHRYATHCPYCQKDLVHRSLEEKPDSLNKIGFAVSAKSLPSSPFGKIEALPNIDLQERSEVQEELQEEVQGEFQGELQEELDTTFVQQAGHVLLSLFSLLAGSFFFFFGLLLLLFSENGTFSLEWKASSWPYFVFSAMFLLLVGLWSVSKIEK